MSKDKIKEEQEASGGRQDEGAGEEKIEQEMSQEDISGGEDSESWEDSPEKEDSQDKEAEESPDQAGQEKKKGKQDPRDVQIEELQDRLKRQMAEFDNFRKRTEKEKSAMYEVGARDIIEKILPVLDNFERGLAAVPEDLKGGSFAEGVEMIYKQFIKTLEDAGVEAIEAVGQQFNPDLHNAVMHIDDEAYGENEISQELQKGYKYRGTVVRHSMVQVAN
ncbi:MAG: nucleotide exchange factor GrpE [Lachnospiraceae bacterium]|jgi:molecular chaperone GrpE|nr:nucleotide exchange factor GrpE [Lachnospiraceae bacterium]